eukprot:scaffold2404_cov398-Prasinococcus_capsulatus_cf.AAC.47
MGSALTLQHSPPYGEARPGAPVAALPQPGPGRFAYVLPVSQEPTSERWLQACDGHHSTTDRCPSNGKTDEGLPFPSIGGPGCVYRFWCCCPACEQGALVKISRADSIRVPSHQPHMDGLTWSTMMYVKGELPSLETRQLDVSIASAWTPASRSASVELTARQ